MRLRTRGAGCKCSYMYGHTVPPQDDQNQRMGSLMHAVPTLGLHDWRAHAHARKPNSDGD